MLYICDSAETLKELMVKEGFTGTFTEYQKRFAEVNPELCAQYPKYREMLPANMPITLVNAPTFHAPTRSETITELLRFSPEERQTLRAMQETERDAPTEIALSDMMEEAQGYAAGFRKWLKTPLVMTPWTTINSSLNDKTLFKLSGETLKFGAERISSSAQYYHLDKLYDNMMKRDLLNRQLHMLRGQTGKEIQAVRRELEKQIKELTIKIKAQLPLKLSKSAGKYVKSGFTIEQIRKMRANAYSAKGARKGKLLTSDLDILNKTGLARLKTLHKGMKDLGQKVGKAATILNYGVVAYDANEAYKTGGAKSAARTFITGASAIYLTSQAVTAMGGTAAVGSLFIGSIAGDAALGGALLICSPVLGWVVVIGAGITVTAVVGYKAKGWLESAWDVGEEMSREAYEKAVQAAGAAHEELSSAWNSGSQWLLDFYGQHK